MEHSRVNEHANKRLDSFKREVKRLIFIGVLAIVCVTAGLITAFFNTVTGLVLVGVGAVAFLVFVIAAVIGISREV